ncbi:flagellar brake protein [Thiorhodovibrio frisius]|uniref:Putative glycosyltransferase n=1 Tax=Thiorhodovibrio frisius TaxID=631362 RepID=H8Z6D1_9GAMM|nr:PilZ domain-containing protein [Thiorhodovibrio frisius]EIC20715.1 putative glycosyltransferase [Thiorhodovibrio frisius]WPL21463.1 Cyclic di-GMP binding protein YcgR [Thiorhodovibrio frisius]
MDSDHINCIDKPEIIAKILTKHFKARGTLCVSTIGGDCKANSKVVDNDPFAEYLLLDALPSDVGETIEHADKVELRGSIESLYSWFHHTGKLEVIVEDGERYYEIPYPEKLFQLQRRNSFRTHLPTRLTATMTGELENPAAEQAHPFRAMLQNLSATGAGMSVSGKTASLISEGTKLYQSRIRVPNILDVTVDADVRNCRPGNTEDELVLGLEFLCLSSKDAQKITRAVMEIQRQVLADLDD